MKSHQMLVKENITAERLADQRFFKWLEGKSVCNSSLHADQEVPKN